MPPALAVLILAAGPGLARTPGILKRAPEEPVPQGPVSTWPVDLTFSIMPGELSPGAACQVVIWTLDARLLSWGRLAVAFEPPIFVDNPEIGFPRYAVGDSFSLVSMGPGAYLIEFRASSAPLSIAPGAFLTLSGTVRQDLAIGSTVSASLDAAVLSSDGSPLKVGGRGAALAVVPEDPGLTLHIGEARDLRPGDAVDVVISTYNPKPISQGQVCLRFDPTVFREVTSVQVFGAEQDVSFSVDRSVAGAVEVSFASPSASINRLDGPMIAIRMRLDPNVPPGLEAQVDFELPGTFLLDSLRRSIPLEADGGEFNIAD